MAWQTPKMDWAAADGVRDTDFNRIEGNILELYNEKVRESRIVYVSKSGNDETGTGTSSNPFYTITKALSAIPKDLNGLDMAVYISGGIYTENVLIEGFSGGILTLTGTAANVTVNSITVQGCIVSCTSLPLVTTAAVGLIVAYGAVFITTGSIITQGASTGVNVSNGSTVHISGVITSSATTAVSCSGNSNLYAGTITGTGTINASAGGVVAFDTSVLNRVTSSGGRINTGSQGAGGGLNPASVE